VSYIEDSPNLKALRDAKGTEGLPKICPRNDFTTQNLLGWLTIMSCGLISKSENGLFFLGGELVNYNLDKIWNTYT